MITLIHSAPKCGVSVAHEPRGETLSGVLLGRFADASTLDPVTACPGCGADLAEAFQAGSLVLENPTGTSGQQPKPKRKTSVRQQAAALVRKAVREMKQRQAAKVAA